MPRDGEGEERERYAPTNLAQSQALWWARFIRDYGITTALSAVLLGVILGFIPSPMFTGAKIVETETRDAVSRMETNSAVMLMRLEGMDLRLNFLMEALDRVTCVMMLTSEQRGKIRTRVELDAQCLWLRGFGGPPLSRDPLP